MPARAEAASSWALPAPHGMASSYTFGLNRLHVDARALALALALALLSGLLALVLLFYQRTQTLADGERLTVAFAAVMQEQTTRNIEALEQRMGLIAQTLIAPRAASATPQEGSERAMLAGHVAAMPFVQSFTVLDAQGHLRFSSEAAPAEQPSWKEQLQMFRSRPGTGLFLEAPRREGAQGPWLLRAARPVLDDRGNLAGVVIARLRTASVDTAWQSLARESGSALSVLRTDGTMLLRSPQDDSAIGRSYADDPLIRQYLPAGASGSFQTDGRVDGSLRLVAYRTLAKYPDLVVVVERSIDAMLAPWRQLAQLVVGGWALTSLILLGAALYLGRISAQRRAAEQRATQSAQRIAVASEAAGVILWDWELTANEWNVTPSHYTTRGLEPRNGPVGHDDWLAQVHPDDRARWNLALKTIGPTSQNRYLCEIRLRLADGSYRWSQEIGQVMHRDSIGRPARVMGVRIDVHDRHQRDHERDQLLERITDGFVMLDAAWRVTYANAQAGQLLGCPADRLIGKCLWEEQPPLADMRLSLACQQAFTAQNPVWLESLHPNRGLWLETHVYPSSDGVSIFMRDVTQRKADERALRLAKEQAESLIASASVMIVGLDANGQITLFNQAAQTLTGYSLCDLAGRNWFDILCPRMRYPEVRRAFEQVSGNGLPRQFENPILTRDGQERIIAWQNNVMREGDTLTGSLSFGIDVTAERRAEQALVESRDQFETLAHHSLQGIALMRKGQLIYSNPAFRAITQRSADALSGFSMSQLMQWVHPHDRAMTVERQRSALQGETVSDLNAMRILQPDGQWRWVLSSIRTITVGGEPTLLGMMLDIHDRKLAEEALRDSEERLRATLDALPDLMFEVDLTGRYRDYHSPRSELLVAAPQELLGKRVSEVMPPVAQQCVMAGLREAASQGSSHGRQIELPLADGMHWFELSIARKQPQPDQDMRFIVLSRDITDRKQLEVREEHERDLLQYLASARPISDILEKFVLSYEALMPGMRGSVLLLDAEGMHLHHGAAPHLPPAFCRAIDGCSIGPAAGSCGTAAFTGQTVIVADVATDTRWADYRTLAAEHDLRACWSVPLHGMQGQVLGTFAFYFDHIRDATPADLSTIERGGQLASQAMERHLAVQALQDSEERYRSLVEWSPEGIGVHQDGILVYANPAAAKLWGAASAQQVIGEPVMRFVHADDRALMAEQDLALLALNAPTPLFECRHVRLDGVVIDVETKSGPITIHGAAAVHMVMRDVTARKQALTDLRESRQQLRVLSAKVLAAQEAERRRVAHELHDELGQALTAIKINLLAEQHQRHEGPNALMAENVRIVEDALQQVRRLALALRPSMLDDLGLAPALRWLIGQTAQRSAIQVDMDLPNAPQRLDSDTETAVFRIVQEALTNIVRHARARTVLVRMQALADGNVTVLVRDDGVGFDLARMRREATDGNSMGLLGMQERATLAGIGLTIDSAPGQGCSVTLRCPVHAAAGRA